MLVVRGWVLGTSPTTAAEGHRHPYLQSRFSLNQYRQNERGQYVPEIGRSFEPVVAEGLQFREQDAKMHFPAIE
jgi:hypothetical protein